MGRKVSDAVRFAINRAKRNDLREMLDATEAEGGSYSAADVRRLVRENVDDIFESQKAS